MTSSQWIWVVPTWWLNLSTGWEDFSSSRSAFSPVREELIIACKEQSEDVKREAKSGSRIKENETKFDDKLMTRT